MRGRNCGKAHSRSGRKSSEDKEHQLSHKNVIIGAAEHQDFYKYRLRDTNWKMRMERMSLSSASDYLGSRKELNYLMSSFTGAEQTDRLWCGWDRREDAEAAHEPYILYSTVLLKIRGKTARGQ